MQMDPFNLVKQLMELKILKILVNLAGHLVLFAFLTH